MVVRARESFSFSFLHELLDSVQDSKLDDRSHVMWHSSSLFITLGLRQLRQRCAALPPANALLALPSCCYLRAVHVQNGGYAHMPLFCFP